MEWPFFTILSRNISARSNRISAPFAEVPTSSLPLAKVLSLQTSIEGPHFWHFES